MVETGEGATVFKSTDWYFQDTSANTALHLSAAGNATFAGSITSSKSTDAGIGGQLNLINPHNSDNNVNEIVFQHRGSGTAVSKIESVAVGGGNNTRLKFKTESASVQATRMIIDESGYIGIGTETPSDFDGESRDLVIRKGVNGTNPTPGITIAGSGNQASTGRGAIRFADGTTGNERYRGAVEYNHNGDAMSFRTAGTQVVTIASDGNTTFTAGAAFSGSVDINGTNYLYLGGHVRINNPGSGVLKLGQYNGSAWTDTLSMTNAGAATFTGHIQTGQTAMPTTSHSIRHIFAGAAHFHGQDTIGEANVGNNAYYNSGFKRRLAGLASNIRFNAGNIYLQTSATDSIDTAITWINAMTIIPTGEVGIGTTPAAGVALDIREDSTTNSVDVRNANSSGYGLYTAGGGSNSQYAFRAANKDNAALFTVYGGGNVDIHSGSLTIDSDTGKLYLGADDDMQVYHEGNDGYVLNNTGDLIVVNYANDKDIKFYSDDGAGNTREYFFLDGSIAASGGLCYTKFPDNSVACWGDSEDVKISHQAGHGYIENGTGTLNITNTASSSNLILKTTNAMTFWTNDGATKVLQLNSNGSAAFSGALSKGSGSFKIDHPLEAKKDTHHLVHSFVEAPQADNIYRGKVTLVDGAATVNIDTAAGMTEGTFVSLNTDIQCFTTNETDWDAVKGSVSGNTLTITCQNSSSTAVVSWMVVGERQDQHMKDTNWTDGDGKVIVEPEKPRYNPDGSLK